MILERNRIKTITLDWFPSRYILETHQHWTLGTKLGVSYEFYLGNIQLFLERNWIGDAYLFNNYEKWRGVENGY